MSKPLFVCVFPLTGMLNRENGNTLINRNLLFGIYIDACVALVVLWFSIGNYTNDAISLLEFAFFFLLLYVVNQS